LIRLAVRCRPELADRVLAELMELAPGGVEEERGDAYVELAIYGPPGELPALPDLEAAAGDGLVEIASSEVPDDWGDRWRDFHEPAVIGGGRLVVRPSWEEGEPTAGTDVMIDPGQAFGTGAHATTRMCLEILLEMADAGEARGSIVDLGTGSGVLAIAAAKLGWGPVVAVDHQPAALDAAAANAEANRAPIELLRLDLRRQAPPVAETLVANLTAPLLLEVVGRLESPPRALICSGLLAKETGRVAEALVDAGLRVTARREGGEWAALRAARSSDGPGG
jgi:ribosomal protein L11 methyltransferase